MSSELGVTCVLYGCVTNCVREVKGKAVPGHAVKAEAGRRDIAALILNLVYCWR